MLASGPLNIDTLSRQAKNRGLARKEQSNMQSRMINNWIELTKKTLAHINSRCDGMHIHGHFHWIYFTGNLTFHLLTSRAYKVHGKARNFWYESKHISKVQPIFIFKTKRE